MKPAAQSEGRAQRPRWALFLALATALAVLGGTLAWAAFDLRKLVRGQIVQRDADILDVVTVAQHHNDVESGDTIAPLTDPGEQFELALKVSRLRDVLGVRLYSPEGKFVNAFPGHIKEVALPDADLPRLRDLQPVSFFSAKAPMEEQTLLAESDSPTEPLLFVEVPLRTDDGKQLAGVAQFIMDGSKIVQEYSELDRNLAAKFSSAFVVGAGLLLAGLGLALRRLQRANQKLAERTNNLLQANRELALAARTSAVGAVASHLIHGLKNPLIGLRSFVHAHTAANGDSANTDWLAAQSTAQRMEELINRVVRVLQEQQSGAEYQISTTELAGLLSQKARGPAEAAGVRFQIKVLFDAVLSNREADLILLVLENLVQNGIEATPAGRGVEVCIAGSAGAICFDVRDEGSGLPRGMEERLFLPGPSGKKGGGGIGLAISKQLALSLGANLELMQNNASGCVFRLAFPQTRASTDERAGISALSEAAPPR